MPEWTSTSRRSRRRGVTVICTAACELGAEPHRVDAAEKHRDRAAAARADTRAVGQGHALGDGVETSPAPTGSATCTSP